ncbi:phytoene desaturase family protein [Adlercreutzia murintestinalis]|uniref:phytoene desaturase family protein n=1 Tax=Adlercreutzia murintestinalis TaxID=2941325 RepID=UPI002041B1BA|nr:NAD(P)/FAD-dependent oxidoreductase [Adlercreutzia murintestinalis]
MAGRIVVVGAGIAGLAAAIYGRLAGYDVEVFEKNAVPGGECTGWDRRGHHIDNCIHWLTGSKPGSALNDVWRTVGALGADTVFVPGDKFFTARLGGREATLWHDLDRTERELSALSPADKVEIKRLIQAVRLARCCEIPADKPLDLMGPIDYLKMGIRMKDMPKVMKAYGDVSLGELAERFTDPLLRMLVNSYMPADYAAYAFIVSYATMASGNGKVPRGGSRALTLRMAARLEELGGRIHLSEPIKRIWQHEGRAAGVILQDGTKVASDYVVYAADMSLLFGGLIKRELMPEGWAKAYEDRSSYPVMSGLQAAFSVLEGSVPSGTTLFACAPFRVGPREASCLSVHCYDYEPAWAPEGRAVAQINLTQSDADWEWWKSLDKDDYRASKEKAAAIFAERLVDEFPEAANGLELLDAWTPLTYERFCGAYRGSYMGFKAMPKAKSPSCKGVIEGLPGLYLAGQWMTSPGGLPIAVTSGKFAIQRIQRSE